MGSRSESVRRAWEHRRALWRVSPGELVELQKRGDISESLKGYAVLAQEEALSLISALGGLENISEQRLVLIQDAARLGLVLRAVLARFLQGDGEPELASRVATITSARRQNLQALGLERLEKELDLHSYLRERALENASDRENAAEPDAASTDVADRASVATSAVVLNTDSTTKRHSGAHGGESHEETKDNPTTEEGPPR